MHKLIQYRLNDFPLDKASQIFIQEILAQPGVKNLVVLPDSFTKDKYSNAQNKVTIPSSTAIVSDKEHFYPLFRSRGINCGMSIIALPFYRDDLDSTFVNNLLNKLGYSLPYYINYRLRLPFIKDKYDLSYSDFFKVLEEGVPYLAKKFSLENLGINNIEFNGLFNKIDLKNDKKYLNNNWLNKRTIRLRNSFGRYFGGNHFFEIQEVISSTKELDLKIGQLVIMFHTAGESLEDIISLKMKQKYIEQSKYKYINTNDDDFKYFSIAHSVLMNLGFAYRFTTTAIINDIIQEIFGKGKQAKIIIDKSHNHFIEEKIGEEKMMVYRHNAERLLSNDIAILSGNNNHSSYIIKAGESVKKVFYTIDHGLGKVINYKKENNNQKIDSVVELHHLKRGVKLFKLNQNLKKELKHNKLVDEYFSLMAKKNIIYKLAELQPIINIKFI